jgi:hypothetical protein
MPRRSLLKSARDADSTVSPYFPPTPKLVAHRNGGTNIPQADICSLSRLSDILASQGWSNRSCCTRITVPIKLTARNSHNTQERRTCKGTHSAIIYSCTTSSNWSLAPAWVRSPTPELVFSAAPKRTACSRHPMRYTDEAGRTHFTPPHRLLFPKSPKIEGAYRLDDVLEPLRGLWVGEVHHPRAEAGVLHHVRAPRAVLHQVTPGSRFLK